MFANYKNLIINILIILGGIGVGLGIFTLIRNFDQQNEYDKLLPNAQAAVQDQKYSEAISLFEKYKSLGNKFSQSDQDKEKVNRELGKLYFLKGQFDKSLSYLDEINLENLSNEDKQTLGDIYLSKNELDKSADFLKSATQLDAAHTFKLANILYELGDLEGYETQLISIEEYKEPMLLLQIDETDLSKILSNIEQASKIDYSLEYRSDVSIDIGLFRSQIESAKAQFDAGKKDFSNLIQIAAFANLNECKFLTAKISDLRKTFESKHIPTYQVDYYEGICANQTHKTDEAIALINRAITADPTVIEYREALAKSYFLKKDLAKLSETYTNIFTISDEADYRERYANELYDLGNIDQALETYKTAFIKAKTDVQKAEISKSIFQISMRDKSDLEICKSEDYLDSLAKLDDLEVVLIRNHCLLFNDKDFFTATLDDYPEAKAYFYSLKSKDHEKLDVVLDADLEGTIVTYYNAVGEQLLK
jgi:tetratricopeptide (TPR) repeat protein